MHNPTIKPQWVIYKNNQRMGQAITWHKALDILIKQEQLFFVPLWINKQQVKFVNDNDSFAIIKER